MADLTPFDQSIYKKPFNNQDRGELVGRVTPKSVIGNLLDIGITHPNYYMPLSFNMGVDTGPSSGSMLLPTFDFVYARDVLYADYVIERGRYDFRKVELGITTRSKGPDSNNAFSWLSEVHVDLGKDYENVVFTNEIATKKRGSVHVFEMDDLIPLGGEPCHIWLLFDDYVDRPYILNPDGSYVRDFNPHFWETDCRWWMDGYMIYLPGLSLDFSGGSKHLIFEWDFAEWIEVYDNGTPENRSDDLVTLRLDNPFPITLKVETYSDLMPIQGDGQPPPDVTELDIRFFDLMTRQIFVRWLNPSVSDYKQTHVIKKEGSVPTGLDDGEKVYSGTFPMLEDNNVELHKDYYYLVVVEDEEGYFSSGEIISMRTEPPVFHNLMIYSEGAPIKVGETTRIDAYGFTEEGEQRAVIANWVVEPDIGTFEYDYGRTVAFTATRPGIGTITASYGGVSDSISIEVIP